MRRAVLVTMALATLVGGCSAGPASPAHRPTPAAFGSHTQTCDRPAPAGLTVLSPRIGGQTRIIRVHVPAGYTGQHAVALVLSLHGTGSSAARQESISGLDATADAHGFLVGYPQGARKTATGFGWNVPGTASPAHGADDLGYLSQVITLLRQRYCVDGNRVYGTGFSGGARMLAGFACRTGNALAGYAAVSGLRAPRPCAPGHQVAVLALHGTADRTDPYAGHGPAYWTYSVPEAAARWAAQDGCAGTPAVTHPYPDATLTSYSGCRAGTEVQLYTLAGGRHVWPHELAGPPGSAPPSLSPGHPVAAGATNEIIWRFLRAHTLA